MCFFGLFRLNRSIQKILKYMIIIFISRGMILWIFVRIKKSNVYHNSFLSNYRHNAGIHMPRIQKRKYEKIEEDEIDLVVRCNDSHEFYEKYRETFPTKKKGIDSISKIWKRRGEFIKKHPDIVSSAESSMGTSLELERLFAVQNKILEDMSDLMKDHLKVSREILSRMPKNTLRHDDHMPLQSEARLSEHKEPVKRSGAEKSNDIMIGS